MFKSLKKVLVGVLASSLVLSSVVFAAGSATDCLLYTSDAADD